MSTLTRLTASVLVGFALAACGSEPPPPPKPTPTGPPPPPPDQVIAADWEAMVACEATGNWAINNGNGFFGGLQFDAGTWAAHGGVEFAASADRATPAQQMEVGNRVLLAKGWTAWPHCSGVVGVGWKKPAPPGFFVPPPPPPPAPAKAVP